MALSDSRPLSRSTAPLRSPSAPTGAAGGARARRFSALLRAPLFSAGLLLSVAASGCASAAVRAAESGNVAALRAQIEAGVRDRSLGRDEVRAIARAVVSNEVAHARGDSGRERVLEATLCAREARSALEDRAEGDDAIAPLSAMILVDADLVDRDDMLERARIREAEIAARAEAPDAAADRSSRPVSATSLAAAWRAVAARLLVEPHQTAERRRLFADGDQRVRVAALRAALEAAAPGDEAAVLEAARLDPYPLARTVAVRAAGAIGGTRVVLALADLWHTADEPLRDAIAFAWASPRALDAGGRYRLLRTTETGRGAPAIASAAALARLGGEGEPEALGVIRRAVDSGTTRDRVYAIGVAPLRAAVVREAVVKAMRDPDPAVALAASAKLLETPALAGGAPPGSTERRTATSVLYWMAEGATTRALSAKSALARAGAREVVRILERDVRSNDLRARETAGVALSALREWLRLAPLLSDPDAHVRMSVACAAARSR